MTWEGQNRTPGQQLSWRDAARTHGWLTAVGVAWGLLAYAYNREFCLRLAPIFGPLVFSIPLNVLFSSTWAGEWLRRQGLLATPEEREIPPEVSDLAASEEALERTLAPIRGSAASLAVIDPYVNALHVSLQRCARASYCAEDPEELVRKALSNHLDTQPARPEGDPLHRPLLDDEACVKAHSELWRRQEEALPDHWRDLIALYPYSRRPDIFPAL